MGKSSRRLGQRGPTSQVTGDTRRQESGKEAGSAREMERQESWEAVGTD